MGENQRKKIAFITGVTGQDGSYLAEFLLKKGYAVHGLVRRASIPNTQRINDVSDRVFMHYGDLADVNSLNSILSKVKPDEIYNLGAQSHVKISFDIPEYTANTTGLGTLRLLEAVRIHCPEARFYQASSSEMFGIAREVPQNENTSFNPQSPYGIAKVFAHHTAQRYRDAYGLFICCGILFNHESPRRGEDFVTRKIARGVVRIKAGFQDKLYLGNLDAKRDWGYAPEYVEAMWLMLQQKKPDDFVIATGEAHSVREFVEEAFRMVGIKDWRKYIAVDRQFHRPNEVALLLGDASKAKKILGWRLKTKFKDLIRSMVQAELANLKR